VIAHDFSVKPGSWGLVTFSATRGEARYIEALPSTMPSQSVNAGM
jgi:hypothetical protein